ncbi:MAG: UDP-N-acetylmuramoyl-L-alanine--D-glutamate ligase [Lachnospiraceae bacterium]|jgi:UDP-N-acetylmuramoylalanine--D-glutamate ligase
MDLFTGKEIKDYKYLIYGMGVSGKGVAMLLHRLGACVGLFDSNEKLNMAELAAELCLDEDTEIFQGRLNAEDVKEYDIITLSPGISAFLPELLSLNKPVLGEIELAYTAARGRLVAITGTNGKTTTTALVGEIMKAAFGDVQVVGNIGTSYASIADSLTEESITVAEISSFQLESISRFHPQVSAILNLTPDHLDRHGTFENYARTKCLIASNQSGKDKCIINYDDEYLRSLSRGLTPEIIYFSRLERLEKGVYLDGEDIMFGDGRDALKVMGKKETNLMGDHNLENVMAAIGISYAMGADLALISAVIGDFKAVEHRIEYVCTKKGVAYYNDSKGTNTDAAAKAVASMNVPTILIAGGYDKGADFTEWIKGFDGRIKEMILIGQTAVKIRDAALGCGFADIKMAGSLEDAVKTAAADANEGEAVLLSPACASWGQFDNYEQRGRLFKEYVRALDD